MACTLGRYIGAATPILKEFISMVPIVTERIHTWAELWILSNDSQQRASSLSWRNMSFFCKILRVSSRCLGRKVRRCFKPRGETVSRGMISWFLWKEYLNSWISLIRKLCSTYIILGWGKDSPWFEILSVQELIDVLTDRSISFVVLFFVPTMVTECVGNSITIRNTVDPHLVFIDGVFYSKSRCPLDYAWWET